MVTVSGGLTLGERKERASCPKISFRTYFRTFLELWLALEVLPPPSKGLELKKASWPQEPSLIAASYGTEQVKSELLHCYSKRFTGHSESQCGSVFCLCRLCNIRIFFFFFSRRISRGSQSSFFFKPINPTEGEKAPWNSSPFEQQYPSEENSFLILALKKLFEINVKTICHFGYKKC